MADIGPQALEAYLRRVFGDSARLVDIGEIGSLDQQGIKDFGYGKPIKVSYEVGGQNRQAVISAMRGDRYGHQFNWDRARILMSQYETAKRMERHARPLGLGFVDPGGAMHPCEPEEFFIVFEKLDGHDYFLDLERIREKGLTPDDEAMVREFARWLAGIHAQKHDDPDLYVRRIRNTVGDCECIFGIIDGYPQAYAEFPAERFKALEKRLVDWRWKLKDYVHRLSAVHGDFHPWNVLARSGADFSVLDRSRGEWGEPADDVCTMALNLALFGIMDAPRLEGDFLKLYLSFWEEYLELTGDFELLEAAAPFLVFRGLVIASPQWYPNHPPQVRRALFRLVENVLEDDRFQYSDFNRYLE